nr:MAG TPA: hypothetical protein [Caudoviricetes sp.]
MFISILWVGSITSLLKVHLLMFISILWVGSTPPFPSQGGYISI